jgi:hypothetical protein
MYTVEGPLVKAALDGEKAAPTSPEGRIHRRKGKALVLRFIAMKWNNGKGERRCCDVDGWR